MRVRRNGDPRTARRHLILCLQLGVVFSPYPGALGRFGSLFRLLNEVLTLVREQWGALAGRLCYFGMERRHLAAKVLRIGVCCSSPCKLLKVPIHPSYLKADAQ